MKNRLFNIVRKLMLFAVLGGFISTTSNAQFQELYLKGIARMEMGEYHEAKRYFEEALGNNNKDPDCLIKIAEACQNTGNTQEAIDYLIRAESVVPCKGSYLMATIYASSGNSEEAVKYLKSHLNSPYKLPIHRILLDDAFSGIEKSQEWKSLWRVSWYSDEEEIMQEINYLNNSGNYLPALEMIDAELERRENQDVLHAARGGVLFGMGQYRGAIQSYNRAIEINSSHPSYFYGRAQPYLRQEKYQDALTDLEKAYRMEPGKLDLLFEIAQVYHETGLLSKAAEYSNRYLEFYPEKTEAHFLLGQILFDSGKYFAALDQFNACLQLDTKDPRFYAARGETYLRTKTYSYALNDFGMALDLDPDMQEVWYQKAQTRWYLNEREGALRDWEHAARLGSFKAAQKLEEHSSMKK